MYEATKLLSSSSLPTQGDLRLAFLGIMAFLQQYKQQTRQLNMVDAIYNKLETYWNQHLSNSSSISAILDPRYKTTTFKNSEERNDCINKLQNLFSLYMADSHIELNRREIVSQDSRNFFLNMINRNDQVNFGTENLEFDEITNYLNTSNEINTDPLIWWKEHQNEYPVLSLIAKDYLIIQATSVAAEQAFSVAGNTITQTRNKLDPETARTILCLKSWIENEIGINIDNENLEVNNDNNSDNSDTCSNYSGSNSSNSSYISNNTNSDTNSDTGSD
jgi:hypothetical protein